MSKTKKKYGLKNWHVLSVLGVILLFVIYNGVMRKLDITANGNSGVIRVVRLQETSHWKGVNKVAAHYVYKIDSKHYTNFTYVVNDEIKVGNCYQMSYSIRKPKNVDIKFGEPCKCPDYLVD